MDKIKNSAFVKKIKNMTLAQKIISICVLIIVVVSAILLIVVNSYMNRINYIDKKFEYLTEEELKSELDIGEVEDPYEVLDSTESKVDFEFKEGITNILLIGADRQGTNGYGRSDCIMIATLDTNNKTIKLSSVLRDCYVQIPEYNDNKINASYAFGGPDLLIETLEVNLGIKLDKYIYVDFDDFKNVIEVLGGADIELTEKETEKVFGSRKEAGKYHLDAKECLNYVRIRKIDSDFGRTSRQRTLMTALYEEFKNKPMTELISTCTEVLPYINTNLTKTEILDLLQTAASIGNLEIQQHVVPADGTYKFATTSSGASIISLDFTENSKLLYQFIYNKEMEESTEVTESSTQESTVVEASVTIK